MSANNVYGPDQEGEFSRPHIDVIQDRMVERARKRMPQADFSRGSPPRHLIDIFSIEMVDLWESLENVYWSAFFPFAAGQQLDHVLAVTGVGRIPRRGATGEVVFETTPTGRQVITDEIRVRSVPDESQDVVEVPFKTTERVVVPQGDALSDPVPIRTLTQREALELGMTDDVLGDDSNVPEGSITSIIDPLPGVVGVSNPIATGETGVTNDGHEYDFVTGRDGENDPEYRLRYNESIALNAKASLPAIKANVYNVPDVRSVRAVENTENVEVDGIRAHGFRVTILAPDQPAVYDDVAQQIYETRSAGIPSSGSNVGTAIMTDGGEKQERCERATEQQVYVTVDADVLETFPNDGIEQMTRNIVSYIGGEGGSGTDYAGQEIGEDVIYDQVFGAAMNVDGVYRADVSLGTNSPPQGKSDVAIGEFEVGRIDAGNVTINPNRVNPS